MAKSGSRSARPHGPRKPIPIAGRIYALRELEAGLGRYRYERSKTDYRLEAYTWRVRIIVPAYDREFVLRIDVDPRYVRVFAEGWAGPKKHAYPDGSLCMWYPKDPPARKWHRNEGLLKLVDTAMVHLFKELYWQETGQWLGEEVLHGIPKVNPQAVLEAA